jgi:hypothetical protein
MEPKGKDPEEKLVGMFALGLRAFQLPNGQINWQLQSKIEGLPIEIILTQVRAWLRSMENDYFNNFDKTLQKGP